MLMFKYYYSSSYDIRAIIGISGVTNMAYSYFSEGFSSNYNSAWGIIPPVTGHSPPASTEKETPEPSRRSSRVLRVVQIAFVVIGGLAVLYAVVYGNWHRESDEDRAKTSKTLKEAVAGSEKAYQMQLEVNRREAERYKREIEEATTRQPPNGPADGGR